MSEEYRSYEDYDRSSNFYDKTRSALGVEVILGVLAATGRPLAAHSALDVGCGTGNYLAALAPHLGALTGLEYSAGMLARSRAKTAHLPTVRLVRGSAFSLPFAERFSAVLFNQVVHHFDQGGPGGARAEDFPMLRQALEQAFAALEPGGVLLMNHTAGRQFHDGYWWAAIIPDAMTRMAERYIALPALEAMLGEVGFEYRGAIVPLDEVLQAQDYLNAAGPLDPSWRRGDSTWTLATDRELEAGLAWLRSMIDDHTVDAWLAERERLRREVGQTVFIQARKPGEPG